MEHVGRSALRASLRLAPLMVLPFVSCRPAATATPPTTPSSDALRASAMHETLAGDSLRVEQVRLGALTPGPDTIRLVLVNVSGRARVVAVRWRFEPGLWLMGAAERTSLVPLAAGEHRAFQLPLRLRRLSPEASLRLRVGEASPDTAAPRLATVAIDRTWPIGLRNPAAIDPRRSMDSTRTPHLTLLAHRGSPAARDLAAIGTVRERAVVRIAEMLGVSWNGRVTLVFYADSATKTNEMGHVGMGWAGNGTIVEIYNDRDRLDPYHQLAHVVAAEVGDPPAALDEGFATWVTESLGADALEHLGHAGRTVEDATCALARAGRRIPLDSLLRLPEFGSAAAPGDVTYPQGAAFVKFLVERMGVERFREAYRTLRRDDAAGAPRALERVLGRSLAEVEAEWHSALPCAR